MPSLGLRIDADIAARLPEMKVASVIFRDVALGMPTRAIEPMRDRVIATARERIAAVRDPRRLPAVAAIHQAFPELGRGSKRLWLDEAFRAIARHDPFPIVNDLVDSARLLALHYAVPICAIDLAKARAPATLAIAPPGTTARTPLGPVADLSGLPVIFDAGGPLASPVVEIGRALPGRQTHACALVAFVPDRSSAIDVGDLQTRAENWLAKLAGARLVTLESAGGT